MAGVGRGGGGFLGLVLLYLFTSCPTVHWLDGGVLITSAWQGVAAHPPGEAGWVGLSQLLVRLPLGAISFRVGLLSLFSVAGCVLLLQRLALRLIPVSQSGPDVQGARLVWAVAVALAPLLSFPVWMQAVRVEVYGLSLLSTLAMLELALGSGLTGPDSEPLDLRRLWRAALVGGLGLSVHPLLVGLAGVPLVVLMVLDRRTWHPRPWVGACVAGGLGFSAVLLLPIRAWAHPELGWGQPGTWSGFWDVILARTFQQNFGPRDGTMWLGNLAVLMRVFPPGVMFLGLFGLLALIVRRRVRLGLFLGLLILTNLASVVSQNVVIEDNPDLHGYLALTHALGWLLAGVTLAEAQGWLRAGVDRVALSAGLVRLVSWLAPGVVGVLVLPPLFLAWPALDRADDWLARVHGRKALERLGLGGHLIVSGNDTTFILQYLQAVEGWRPDVAVMPRALLTHPWFRARLGVDVAQAERMVRGTLVSEPFPVRVELREQDLSVSAQLCPAPAPGWGFYDVAGCARDAMSGEGEGLLHLPGVARGPQALAVGWLASALWVQYLQARGEDMRAQAEASLLERLLAEHLGGFSPSLEGQRLDGAGILPESR